MFRSRTENFRAVYVLLFLNIAFFLIEQQDPEKYARLFSFNAPAIADGQVWRLVTWQFTQSGQGFMGAISLFFTLLLLYIMGSALEDEWGSWHFLALFALSTIGSAAVATAFGIPLLGTYFVYFTLLFVYASVFPRQTFFLFAVVPVRVTLLAFLALGVLLLGVFSGARSNLAALGGAITGYSYFLAHRQRVRFSRPATATAENEPLEPSQDGPAAENAARFSRLREAMNGGSAEELDQLLAATEARVVPGVNICPPADFKPEGSDGYCLRCEGFAECSVRFVRAMRTEEKGTSAPGARAASNPMGS